MQNPNPQTVSEETGMDTDVTTWALPEGAIARLGRGRVETLGLSPDGKYLAVGTWIGLWWYELATMKPVDLWETERGMISALEFSPNGALLATGNWDGGVKVWDVQNHRCLAKMQRTGLFDRASELVFSPNGQHLASSGGRYDAIYVWHPETGEQIAKFTVDEKLQPRHRPTRIPLAFSPDGKFLIGATPENTFTIISLLYTPPRPESNAGNSDRLWIISSHLPACVLSRSINTGRIPAFLAPTISAS